MNAPAGIEPLWGIRERAQFLGYSESTLAGMVTKCPEKLPPRVQGLGRARWSPLKVQQWAVESSHIAGRSRVGRPRRKA